MLKVITKIFVTLFISLFYLNRTFSAELNYLKLYGLRNQHKVHDSIHGRTSIELNSSKRFLDLYHSIESNNIEKLREGVGSAYNRPLLSKLLLSQTILYQGFAFEVSTQDFLIAQVSNPVFPELYIFNAKADTFSIQKAVDFKNTKTLVKISYFNKWYIDKIYSLEQFVTDESEINLKSGKAYTPVYLDMNSSISSGQYNYIFNLRGVELFNSDKYSYYDTRARIERKLTKKLKISIDLPVIYKGEYSLFNDLQLGATFRYNTNLSLRGFYSRMRSEVHLENRWGRFYLDAMALRVKRSFLEESFVDNVAIRLGFDY